MRWVITDPRGPRAALDVAPLPEEWKNHSRLAEPLPRHLDALAGEIRVDRLGVYADAYFIRLADSLASDFKAVARALGTPDFRRLAADYLLAHPSDSAHIGDIGTRLPSFLETHAFSKSFPFLPDLAWLEWTAIRSLYKTRLPAPGIAAWSQVAEDAWPAARFVLDPTVHLLTTAWPVDQLWEERGHAEGESLAQLTDPARRRLVIYRDDAWIQIVSMDAAPFFALERIREGATLDQVCTALAEAFPDEADSLPIMQWFGEWVQRGIVKDVQFPKGVLP